jgi:hypothetical protein
MNKTLATHVRKDGLLALGATLLLGAGHAAADGPEPSLQGWLGREFTIDSSTINDHIPVGGKLTFVYDSSDNVVRVCTRTVPNQRGPWRMDFAVPCNVTLTYTAGLRYCTREDVKAGNAEVLSQCHRIRTRDVAMRPSRVRGAVELNDMIVFLVEAEGGKHAISILVDSPARVTDSGVATGKD